MPLAPLSGVLDGMAMRNANQHKGLWRARMVVPALQAHPATPQMGLRDHCSSAALLPPGWWAPIRPAATRCVLDWRVIQTVALHRPDRATIRQSTASFTSATPASSSALTAEVQDRSLEKKSGAGPINSADIV